MEDRQELRQLQIVQIFFFFTKERRNLINEPDGKLLLVTDGETTTSSQTLSSFDSHIGTDSPVETTDEADSQSSPAIAQLRYQQEHHQ